MNTTPCIDNDPVLSDPTVADALSPEKAVARSINRMIYASHDSYGVPDNDLASALEEQGQAIARGDLSNVRRMLASQVQLLERLADHLLRKAMASSAHFQMYEKYLRLAMRAQSLFSRTVSLLKSMGEPAKAKQRPMPMQSHASFKKPTTDQVPSAPASPANRLRDDHLKKAWWRKQSE